MEHPIEVNNNYEFDDEEEQKEYQAKLNLQFKDEIDALANLSLEDACRGTTPENIDKRCGELCKLYIGGSWHGATKPGDIVVRRINGGLTNQLYQVTLMDNVPSNCTGSIYDETNEPREVSIKLYQPKHMDMVGNGDPERLSDTIISTMVSQANIGPKIYGIFEDGIVQGYYKHEQFRLKHQQDPNLVGKLAVILAQIHHLNVPLPKTCNRQIMIRNKLQEGLDEYDLAAYGKKLSLDSFVNHSLAKETDLICTMLENCDIPQVFCHNDFRGSNILVVDEGKDLVVCDYEYSAYGQRTSDLAQIMIEWDKEATEQFTWKPIRTESIEMFVSLYIEECERINPGYSKLPINSLDRIVREVKFMILSNCIFISTFMLALKQPIIESFAAEDDQKLKMVALFFQMYLSYKESLVKEGLLTNDGQLNL